MNNFAPWQIHDVCRSGDVSDKGKMRGLFVVPILIAISSLWFFYLVPYYHPNVPSRVNGTKALVTGASLGIGKEIAREFAKLNVSQLVLVARSEDKLNALKNEIISDLSRLNIDSLPQIHIIAADLSTENISKTVVQSAVDLMGGIDYLVLNHITNSQYGLWTSHASHDFLANMFFVNTFSYIWMTTAALPFLQNSRGQIVVVSSFAGWVGVPFTATYSSTKHALRGFFNALRTELELYPDPNEPNQVGITICNIGAVNTEGSKEFQSRIDTDWVEADGVAKAIIAGAAMKYREVYYPLYVYPTVILHFYFPKLLERMLKMTMN
jgi:corticosteroid 11-beta-dehydrogenase isozyme 1